MAAQNKGCHVAHGHIEFLSKEVTETRTVQNASHAADLVVGQTAELAQRPNHRIQRVGDADNEGVGRVGSNAFANGFHDLKVDAQKVITAHAGFARNTSGHDAHVGACDIRVIRGTLHIGIKAFGGTRFGNIQRLALGQTIRNVEQDNVAQFLDSSEVGKRAPDVACADKGNFSSGHGRSLRWDINDPSTPNHSTNAAQDCASAAESLA